MLFIILTFLACSAMIVVAGTGLSRYANIVAEKTGIGKLWAGMTAVAFATSLPELTTGISAVAYAGSPNIALGDALGSCVFNLAILALIDFMYPTEPMQVKLGPGSVLSAGFGVIIIGLTALGLVLQPVTGASLWHISLVCPFIVSGYFAATRITFQFEKRELSRFIKKEAEKLERVEAPLRRDVAMLVMCGAGVALGGTLLPKAGLLLAERVGLGHGFVGSVLIAVSTSLPELVVSISAVRLGALDIAAGNIFGSNIFNCVVIVIDDLVYTDAPILAAAAGGQLVTAMIALVMTGVALVGLIYKSHKKSFMKIGWDSAALVMLYAANVVTSYFFSGGK